MKDVGLTETDAQIIEAIDGPDESTKGLQWLIRVIKSGRSKNGNIYRPAVLSKAAPLFEGVKVYVRPDAKHSKMPGADFGELIGQLSSPRYVDKSGDGEILANFNLLKSAGEPAEKILESHQRGFKDLFGFSIIATGSANRTSQGRLVENISRIKSVDLVVEPSAGGKIVELVESDQDNEEPQMENEALFSKIDEMQKTMVEALKAVPPKADESNDKKISEFLKNFENKSYFAEALAGSNLPDIAKEKIKDQVGKAYPDKEGVDKLIESERAYVAKFIPDGKVKGLGDDISLIEAEEDKHGKLLDAFFDVDDGSVQSFKECYIQMTGDKQVTGRQKDCTKLTEAVTTAHFSKALGDSITRRLIAAYRLPSAYMNWRPLVNIVPVSDFRSNKRVRIGGYSNLPTVAAGASYTALTTPGDEEAEYAVAKRGGTEVVNLEAVRNDDVGVVRRIPTDMARAAQRTIGTFVFDFLSTNPVIYDAKTLFHADHNNLGTTALSDATYAAGRLMVLKQTEKDSGQRIGSGPSYLVIPMDLEQTAYDMFKRDTNNDPDFLQTVQPTIIPVWYWTDANNWYLSTNPMDVPTIEIGFLGGQQEPEVFTQDNPSQGSVFSNDQITYKMRHVYGGVPVEYRGLQGNIVP